MMQPPPPQMMMSAEESKRRTMNMLLTLFLVLGLALLAAAWAVWSAGSASTDLNVRRVWAPVAWDVGMFFLIMGIFGMALMRQDLDPIARLLMYLVSFILVLLIFTAPYLIFLGPPGP